MDSLTYWKNQPTDKAHLLNGFKGTWNFSDHNLIPEPIRNFVIEAFPKFEKFKQIPLEDINKTMNDIWEGPGSMPKLISLTYELRAQRTSKSSSQENLDPVKTIDDFSDEEKSTISPSEIEDK